MGLTMPQRAVYYSQEYIEHQIKEAEGIVTVAQKRLRFWESMREAKLQQQP